MLTVYKNGKIYMQATDKTPYIPTYEVESLKKNTLYNVPENNQGGLSDGIKDLY